MRSPLMRTKEWVESLFHPSRAALLGFSDDALEARVRERIGSHLQHCPACQSRLERMQEALKAFGNVSKSSMPMFGTEEGLKRLVAAMQVQESSPAPEQSEVEKTVAVYDRLLSELSIYIGRNAAEQLLDKCDHAMLQRDRLNETVRPMMSAFLGERAASAVVANVLRIWDGTQPAMTRGHA